MAGKPPEVDRAVVEANLAPIDYAMFECLPDEGSALGYHPLFKSTRQVTAELNKSTPDGAPPLKAGGVGARIRVLHAVGLVVPLRSLAGSIEGWQRTPRSKYLLEQQRELEAQGSPDERE